MSKTNPISANRSAQGTASFLQQAQQEQQAASAPARTTAAKTSQAPVTPQTHVDGVVTKPVTTATTSAPMTAEQRQIADNQREIAQLREQLATKEKQQAEEAKTPGFKRALVEIFEFLLRWTTPFFNMISAAFRIIKIGYDMLIKHKSLSDEKDELARLTGDLVGCFFPPAGAIANAGMNFFDPFGNSNGKGHSELFGGLGDLFSGYKYDPLRMGANKVIDVGKEAFNGAKSLVTGKQAAGSGGIQTRPLAPTVTPVG